MTKKRKKNTPKKHPIFFGFFRVFTAVATYKFIEKRLKMSPKKPACTLFAHFFSRKFPEGSFSGFFRTFQLQIGGKISWKKGVFWVFFRKNFCFFSCFTTLRWLVQHFTWGENSHFVFLTFFFRTILKNCKRLRSDICEKNFAGKKRRTAFFNPYSSLVAQGGVSFPYVFFVQKPLLKIASDTRPWIVLQYYYIGIESRGGVDVIPWTTVFEKRVFRDLKLKTPFFRFFFGENFVHFGFPAS
jgi:hypothetical protein